MTDPVHLPPAPIMAAFDQHFAAMNATVEANAAVLKDVLDQMSPETAWLVLARELARDQGLNDPASTLIAGSHPVTNLHLALAAAIIQIARARREGPGDE